MNNPIRIKYFLWLSALLLAFFAINSLSLLIINLEEILGREENWMDELYEWLLITAVGAAVLPLFLLAAWHISRHMLAPLRYIAHTANRIRGGQLAERIRVPPTHDEIADLSQSVNQAFDRYEEAVHRQQQFSGVASHQLRTPLTAMRNFGEVALQKERSQEEYREAIADMLEEAERLSHVVEQLLMMARLGGEEMQETFAPLSMTELIESVTEQFGPTHRIKQIALRIQVDPAYRVHGHKALLEQALANLLDNAIRHTPEEGHIEVRAERDGDAHIRLILSDSGPGFTPLQRERLRDLMDGENADVPRLGLGLTIVSDIVRIHRGGLFFDNATGGGAQVTMRLPAAVRTYTSL